MIILKIIIIIIIFSKLSKSIVKYTVCANIILFYHFYHFFFKIMCHLSRRLAKRDRKELELIDHSISSRLKRHRGDGKRDDDSGDSSDVDMRDRTPNADDSRSKLSSEA